MSALYSLGVMTGTSCDGADLALLRIDRSLDRDRERLCQVHSRAFPAPLRARLRTAQSGCLGICDAAILTRDYSAWLGLVCSQAITRWRARACDVLIAVHGQTVWHAPERGVSVQLLDPSLVAALTGCTVTAAFRQPDLARGGQGAPLVAAYHWLRAVSGELADTLPFAIHNVGGIANVTYLTRRKSEVIAFDTGPGNALIDLAAEQASGGRMKFDRDGKIARSAINDIDWNTIERLGRLAYFRQPPPKSTGREVFHEGFLKRIPGKGAAKVANATALTAHTMAKAYADFVLTGESRLSAVYVVGGGARNPTLMKLFARELARLTGRQVPMPKLPESFAPPQYLEAMAFARLGYEALQGNPISLSTVTGATEDAIGAGVFPGKNYRRLLRALT